MTTTELESTRQINATPEEVYAVWLDPACPGSPWYGPNANGMTSKVIFTAKVDAVFYHCVNNKGQAWYHYGRFTRLEPNKVAEHTWLGEWTKGLETIVETTFEAKDGGTLVTLRHTGVPDDDVGRQHKQGWDWCLHQLAEKMSKK